MSNLNNKNIIVTGASGGIGNSIVEKLNEKGANILASGTKLEKLERLKSKFNNIKILNFDLSFSNFSILVPDAKIFAPFSINFSIIELPIPPDAPVTIIFLLFKSLILLDLLYHSHY